MEYVKTWNGAVAYQTTYPKSSYNAACVSASALLSRLDVQTAIDEYIKMASAGVKKSLTRSFRDSSAKGLPLFRRTRVKATYVYIIRSENGLFKIGVATDVEARFATLNTASPVSLEIFARLHCGNATQVEGELHRIFGEHRVRGEWFALSHSDLHILIHEYGFIKEA